ncbi:MAG: hypothetical protein A2015_12525 [Spirochaetes bacterium GWF1_31_7]|nr:MAG: hypothetical protein A2015_12525 [Spirochaetes bacterium GWF1_31_7]HBD93756.1 hypothetical protein [Spirochaetia bacterium]
MLHHGFYEKMEKKMIKYTNELYEITDAKTQVSAQIIVPLIVDLFKPQSVLDAGCGHGIWLNEFRKHGIEDTLGIDFSDDAIISDDETIISGDWSVPVEINRQFDMVLSLEVGEHIPENRADMYIDNLTRLSDVIIFSAAIPGQGGPGHVNERWPFYWQKKFNEKGFKGYDVIREAIWENDTIHPWYRQNIIIFIKEDSKYIANLPEHTEEIRSLVHPEIYSNKRGAGELFYCNPDLKINRFNDGYYKILFHTSGDLLIIDRPEIIKYLDILTSNGGAAFINDFSDLNALDYLRENDIIRKVVNPHLKVQKNPDCITRLSIEGRLIYNHITKETFVLDPIEDIIWNTIGLGKNMMFILGESCLEKIKITIPDLLDGMETMLKNNLLYAFSREEQIIYEKNDIRYDAVVMIDPRKSAYKKEFFDTYMIMSLLDGRVILLDNFYGRMWELMNERQEISAIIDTLSKEFGNRKYDVSDITGFIYYMHEEGFLHLSGQAGTAIKTGIEIGKKSRLLVNWHNTLNDQKDIEKFLLYSTSPWFAVCEVNYECNFKCITCYASEYCENEVKTERPYLNTEEYKKLVIDQLRDENVFHLTFMGGEPFLRDDFEELYSYAVSKGFFVKIQTNGSLIDKETAKKIKDAGVRQVEVSLDGVDSETNDYIRGKGSFDTAIQALTLLKEAEIPRVGICFTITKHSLGQVEKSVDFARSLGIDEIFFSLYAPMSHNEALNKELKLTNHENSECIQLIRDLQMKNTDMVLFAITDCEAGKRVCAIGPSGDVRPCTLHSAVAGNIRDISFKDIWYSSRVFREIRWPYLVKESCSSCGSKFFCSQTFCSAREYLYNGRNVGEECIQIDA